LAIKYQSSSYRLFFIFLAFLFGVGIHSWFFSSALNSQILLQLMVGFLGFALFSFSFARLRGWTFIFLLLFALSGGLWRYTESFPPKENSVAQFIGQEVRITGIVTNDPENNPSNQEIILADLEANNLPIKNKLVAWVGVYPSWHFGDQISFRCKIKEPQAIDEFAYDRYLLTKGVVAMCASFDEPLLLSENNGSQFRAAMFRSRNAMRQALSRVLPHPHATIASGLLLGIKELPESLETKFRDIGVSHIMAASGYNVAVVLEILLGTLAYIMRRNRAFWFLLLGVILYVLLAGGEAAVVRAGLMGAIVLIARESGRAAPARNLLLFAAVLMLLVNPRLLRDDVGFQLSLLATTGLTIVGPKIRQRLLFLPGAFGIQEALAATLAATLFTLPITIWNFGVPSFISPIANLLILPLVPYAMAFSAFAALVGSIVVSLGPIFAGPAWAVLQLMIFFARSLSGL